MKRGARKLCDIPCHLVDAVALRADVEQRLKREKIPFDVHSGVNTDDGDYWRYYVPIACIRRAKDALPLALRGFRALGEALHPGKR